MKSIRQLNNKTKLCGACLLAFGAGALVSLWLLGELGAAASQGLRAGHVAGTAGVQAGAELHAQIANTGIWASGFLLAGLAASALLGLWLAAEVARPLKQAAQFAKRVADGDLGGKLAVEDGGDAGLLLSCLQELNDKLHSMMRDVRSGAQTLVRGTGEIAQGSMDLSSRTEQQGSSLEETASSMEELTATVKQNADHAHQASKLAISASEVAVKGGAVVSEVVGTMASINESSKRIAEIIGVIDGIAFQTNILALNAAVEAARAGEQGRGFAVVASEVRSLAQRSAAAAKEIKELIDDSVAKVDAGTQLADKAGNTMNEVVSSVKRVTDIISEIADASAEQTTGIDQVNHAIAAMDQATQQNAVLVEQSAAAAASMREQADTLTQLVSAFGRQPGVQKPALPAPEARAKRRTDNPTARAPARAQPQPNTANPASPGSPARAARNPAPAPRRVRGGAQPAVAPDTNWEEF
jgi:methyl-accepting chemotaxis protein